jgi:hypothetical protein
MSICHLTVRICLGIGSSITEQTIYPEATALAVRSFIRFKVFIGYPFFKGRSFLLFSMLWLELDPFLDKTGYGV